MVEKDEDLKQEWDNAWQDDSLKDVTIKVDAEIKAIEENSKVKACPHCDSSSLSERKFKTPRFFCSNCKKFKKTVPDEINIVWVNI